VTDRPHHRPLTPGDFFFEGVGSGDIDPLRVAEAADRAAYMIVRRAHDSGDREVAERVLHLADTEGIEAIAEVWSGSAPDSLAGCLWRLYLLRSWVYADPVAAAREFDGGRRHTPVYEVVAGVVDPPGPDEVRDLTDQVLRGVVQGDFADTLYRAAAFARVVAAGRAHVGAAQAGTPYDSDLSASRLFTMAEQLEEAAALELEGHLA
jgi:hypothetical protein